jgi:hypothetical protein
VTALFVLALGNPESGFHFTIFWPYYVWDIKSPGYGLGHSISYLFRGDVLSAFETHILGIPAVVILAWRVVTLQVKQFQVSQEQVIMANVMDILPEVPAGEQAAISGVVNGISEENT